MVVTRTRCAACGRVSATVDGRCTECLAMKGRPVRPEGQARRDAGGGPPGHGGLDVLDVVGPAGLLVVLAVVLIVIFEVELIVLIAAVALVVAAAALLLRGWLS
jgi:hypothetical protein